ncbi:carboxypeptidase-like regulatory domain-containing protein [Bacteroides thetaiotaomicron]|nr:carboxypeptidase-like regulatory domain-containing protein [Bacteroides thetaiotaomicron]
MVEGRSRGVITDLDGTFVIEVLPTDKLVVSFSWNGNADYFGG